MNRPISQRQKQWLWFAALWCGGFCSLLAVSLVIKLIMHLATV